MSKKGKKSNTNRGNNTNRLNRWTFIGLCISLISLVISLSFNIRNCAVQQPQIAELAMFKQDFPMVQHFYEAIDISKAIPVPEALKNTKNLDYFPTILLNTSQNPEGAFENAAYGYVLTLSSGSSQSRYIAIDPNNASKKIVFSISELREKRNSLIWFFYEGPFPPEGWTNFEQ